MSVKIMLTLFLILFYFNCSEDKKLTYKEIFTLKTLADNSRIPQPITACQDTMRAMEACAALAPEFSSFTLTETIFASTLSSNKYTSYSDYCTNTVNNVLSKDQSDSVKECFFKCDTSYWQTRKNLSICNVAFNSMLTGSAIDSGTISCKRNCVSSTNNIP